MKKPSVLIITPGPDWYVRFPISQRKYLALSDHMSGYVLSTSSKAEKIQIGNFLYQSCIANRKLKRLRFFIFSIKYIIEIRKKTKIDAIIVYDPLLTGIFGCIIKYILRTKLIVEINGVYTSKIVWADEPANLILKFKRLSVFMIMFFVLYTADGIKLLFPGQIGKFSKLTAKRLVSVFPDFVPVSCFPNLEEKKEVLFAGFPFYLKGLDILIQSFKKIEKEFPDWKLKILGWYPDKTLLDKAIGDDPQIFHHPPVPPYEMPKHIGQCAIFVLPSRSEAMGRVLVEAAAAGKPRIGTKVDGIPTVINDGIDGFLVESENVDQLAQKMSFLMADASLRKTIGGNASKRAMIDFSEDNYVQRYVNLITELIQK